MGKVRMCCSILTIIERNDRSMVEKKKKEKPKFTLTSMQEVTYQRDFKMADRAGGFDERRTKH